MQTQHQWLLATCPGCDSWQLEYQWGFVWKIAGMPPRPTLDVAAKDELEDIIMDHMLECFGVPT